MSLNDKLKAAASESAAKLCKVALLLEGPKLTTDEKKNLKALLDVGEKDPTRVPSSTLGTILREEGFDISNSAIDRHRKTPQTCACLRAGVKK